MDLLVEAALRRAAGSLGCLLCRVGEEAAIRYLRTVLGEGVNDGATQCRLHQSWGFCRRHAWQFLGLEWGAMNDSLGTATIAEGLVEAAGDLLDTHLASGDGERRKKAVVRTAVQNLVWALTPAEPCPACRVQAEQEDYALTVLVHVLDDLGWRERFAASPGLCLPHLRVALASSDATERADWIVADSRRRLRELQLDLEEYGRKHDHRFSQDRYGSEFDAPLRAVGVLAGSWFDLPRRPRPTTDRTRSEARVKEGEQHHD
jgi:hypothetical protein